MKSLALTLAVALLPISAYGKTADAGHGITSPMTPPVATQSQSSSSSSGNGAAIASAVGVSLLVTLAANYAWHKWAHPKPATRAQWQAPQI